MTKDCKSDIYNVCYGFRKITFAGDNFSLAEHRRKLFLVSFLMSGIRSLGEQRDRKNCRMSDVILARLQEF